MTCHRAKHLSTKAKHLLTACCNSVVKAQK